MSYTLTIRQYSTQNYNGELEDSPRFITETGVYSMPNRNMRPVLQAFESTGLATDSASPAYEHGQVSSEKLEAQSGDHVTAAECQLIVRCFKELLADDSEMEYLYEYLDVEPGQEAPVLSLLTEWIEFNRIAARCDGFIVD
ncbi:MAG: hypothetical protein MK135_16625 [Polyangiaceae bacterium]|nr:hypothetical protein [Polyangiaceae bacterium]